MKEASEKVSLKLNIKKTKFMAYGPIISWQVEGGFKRWRQWQISSSWILKITADGDWSHEIRRRLLLGRKVMTNLNSVLKSKDLPHFSDKGLYSQGSDLSSSHIQMWELDHKERRVMKNWCFQTVVLEKTLESPFDSKVIKPVNLKEINPGYLLEGLMLKLKLQYFGHLIQTADS